MMSLKPPHIPTGVDDSFSEAETDASFEDSAYEEALLESIGKPYRLYHVEHYVCILPTVICNIIVLATEVLIYNLSSFKELDRCFLTLNLTRATTRFWKSFTVALKRCVAICYFFFIRVNISEQ
jgi:hypothetical protein